MIRKAEVILLRRQEVRETSLLLTGFSRDLGKFQGLVKGVRGARAAVPWYLEPLTLQAVVLYERKRSPWFLISSCDLLDAFEPIRRDLTRLAYGSFFLDLVDAMTAAGDPNPEIFELLLSCLRALGSGAAPRAVVVFLQIHLLRSCGLLPAPETLSLPSSARALLEEILKTPVSEAMAARLRLEEASPGASALRPDSAGEEELGRFLTPLVRRAVERPLPTQAFLLSLGEGSHAA